MPFLRHILGRRWRFQPCQQALWRPGA